LAVVVVDVDVVVVVVVEVRHQRSLPRWERVCESQFRLNDDASSSASRREDSCIEERPWAPSSAEDGADGAAQPTRTATRMPTAGATNFRIRHSALTRGWVELPTRLRSV
jgi:hypothetical protein